MPTSQADKHISFRLSGGGPTVSLTLTLNPSMMQISTPVRQSTTQTLGGIFKDIADLGIKSIQLQGNTGWRGGNGLDGFQTAQYLYTNIFKEFVKRFTANPGVPELLMTDDLNGYSYSISMDDFQTVQDKSSPLLIQYTIPITVLQDMSEPPAVTPDTVQQLASNTQGNANNATAIANSQSSGQTKYYTVQPGDTLWAIAQSYYGDGNQYTLIAQANNISAPYNINAGQVLTIPPG